MIAGARERIYQVKVLLPGEKRAKLLTPSGHLTRLQVHASIWRDRPDAVRVCREIEEQNEGAVAVVVPR